MPVSIRLPDTAGSGWMGSFRLSWEEARAFAIEHLRRRPEGHRAFLTDDEWREEIWTIEHGEPTLVTKGD